MRLFGSLASLFNYFRIPLWSLGSPRHYRPPSHWHVFDYLPRSANFKSWRGEFQTSHRAGLLGNLLVKGVSLSQLGGEDSGKYLVSGTPSFLLLLQQLPLTKIP
jgi:hypothetical protein